MSDRPLNSPPLAIRVATQSDAEGLAALINTAFRSEKTGQTWLYDSQDKRRDIMPTSLVATFIASADCVMFFATTPDDTSGEAAATCYLRQPSVPPREHMTPGAAWLGFLAVHPKFHRKGFGLTVLKYAEEYVQREWGARRLEFDYVSARIELGEWYRRCGYEETGKRQGFPYTEDSRDILAEGLEMVVVGKDLN